MPRVEAEICRRLRKFRENTQLSQVAFARSVGLDSNQLGNLEYERTPLRFQTAEVTANKFGMSLDWLATGKGEMRTWEGVSASISLRVPDRMLFSEAFETVVKPAKKEREKFLEHGGIKSGQDLADAVARLHDDLPPGLAAEFSEEIYKHVKQYTELWSGIRPRTTKKSKS